MFTVTFERRFQIWRAAFEDDSRPVLRGVYVDPLGFLVAANGYILAAVPCAIDGEMPTWDIIIPAFWLQEADTWLKASENLVVSIDEDTKRARIEWPNITIEGPLIPGTYPKWKELIPTPSKEAGGIINLDSDLLLKLSDALDCPKGQTLSLFPSDKPTDPVLVYHDGAVGAIMPMFVGGNIKAELGEVLKRIRGEKLE